MADVLRWGILGTGNIAAQFAAAMSTARRGRVVAVASRSMERARTFAEQYEIVSAYSSYQDLLDDRAVDAVYVALPNTLHHEWTIKSLQSSKHVLCEKPFAASLSQAQEMFDESHRAGKLLVEAFMYLSHPVTLAVQEAIRKGAIGDVRLIRASFCFRLRHTDANIRFDPALGGGAMMDVGCYCTNFACLLANDDPDEVQASARMHERGVDESVAGVLRFPSGVLASFTCGMTVQANNAAYVCGTEGYIEIPVPWKPPARGAQYIISQNIPPRQDAPKGATPSSAPRDTITVDASQELYALEADDFAAAVLDGAAPRVSRELTLRNMRILDEIRRQIGLHF